MATTPRYWIIQATRNGQQIPTFVLDGWIQGILTEDGACVVARDIVGNGASVFASPIHDLPAA